MNSLYRVPKNQCTVKNVRNLFLQASSDRYGAVPTQYRQRLAPSSSLSLPSEMNISLDER